MNYAVQNCPAGQEGEVITLAGKKWLIPMLSARQNRIIDPLILRLLPVFLQWQRDKETALSQLTREQYEALQELTYQAISRAAPELTRDGFLDMSITLPELVAAFPVIAEQTGIFSRGESPGGGAGEAQAGNALTGTGL